METRIKQIAPDLPTYFRLEECALGAPLQHKYTGAGAALIACTGDEILDLEYVENHAQAANFWLHATRSGCEVYFGMCSCVCLTDPLEITDAQDEEQALMMIAKHGGENNFMGW